GYIASFQNHCFGSDVDYTDFWRLDSDSEVHHFIGKDIINFHALFWPAILKCAEFRTPSKIHVHGFLTVNGEKMSKSRGTYITAKEYLDLLDPDLLRYYFASKLSESVEDIDINLDDFVSKINADLVGKLVNIASRCSKFIEKEFDSRLSVIPENELHDSISQVAEKIGALYESTNYASAIREIMMLADKTNRFLDENKPWILIKDAKKRSEVHEVCSIGLDMFKTMVVFLKPVIPGLADKAEQFLGTGTLSWQDIFQPIHKKELRAFEPLLIRVDSKTVKKLVKTSSTPKKKPRLENKDSQVITIDHFQKVDLRVAQILSAEIVSGADKLLKLDLNLGHQETRTVFSGIRSAYKPDELKGKLVVLVANLASRKMKFGVSEGMILAASNENDEIFLLEPSEFSKPGMKIS
ncbi:MAG: methionine--tRNA ligase subunit beta, partial [Gammaproteobacteria bacterium]|nr:methionine--tRNA ligase subunit beta [Gammaproteobacteria bacterium]